jgi:hypothetical protein
MTEVNIAEQCTNSWEGVPSMEWRSKAANVLESVFIGRPDAFALQKRDGKYSTIRQPITRVTLERHILGVITCGTYVLNAEQQTRYGIYDFDDLSQTTRETIIWLCKWYEHWDLQVAVEFSGRKGFHAWLVLKNYVSANKLLLLMEAALNAFELETGIKPQVEVFPKQAIASDLGSLIKVPWGIHQVSGKRSLFLDSDFKPLTDLGLSLIIDLKSINEAFIDEVLAEQPQRNISPSSAYPDGKYREDIVKKFTEKLSVGRRRPTLVSIAGYLKAHGIPEEAAVALLLPWAEKQFVEPLPPAEIEKHVRGIFQRYGAVMPPKPEPASRSLATIYPSKQKKRRRER